MIAGANPPPDPMPPPNKPIPVLIYIAYGAAIMFNLFCGFLIIMYGATLAPDVANEWLIMGVFNVLSDWFVIKPIQFLQAATIAFLLQEFAVEIAIVIENLLDFVKDFVRRHFALDIPLNCRTTEIDLDAEVEGG